MFIRLFSESIFMAVQSLINNKLRTFLSLLGVTIGIFAIISVFTVIDSLRDSIETSVESLGDNVIYVQKWPWEFGPNYQWWKYLNRPVAQINELSFIQRKSINTEAAAFMASTTRTITYETSVADFTPIIGVSDDYPLLRNFEIENGRYISAFESMTGRSVAIIGYELAKRFFDNNSPIGKTIKIGGNKVTIIGVFKKEGTNLFNNSNDYSVLVPINYLKKIFDIKSEQMNPLIMVKAKPNILAEEITEELRSIMRAIRRLRPMEEDNFALNRASLITQGFNQLFVVIDLAGMVIGGFAILVGGFGIANIMFVSVKERTKLIGIQKSLGAKNYMIMTQFLTESVTLSLMGGAVGLLLIFSGTLIANSLIDMSFALSLGNILTGIIISIAIGVVSGFAPAWSASKLNPVVAINSNF